MRNKKLVFVIAFIATAVFHINKLSAQAFPIKLGLYPKNIQVSTINGVDAKDVYTLDLQVPYGENIVEPWSIAVRVTSPIELRGTIIPSEKIGIRFNKVTGTGGISLGDVGVNNQTKYELNHNTPISLINAINTVLKNNKIYEFHFDIIVEGGNYLAGLHPWEAYPFGLTFYITVGTQTSIIEKNIDFRVSKIEGDNTIPEFGFEVKADAALNFNTPEDYTKQVENSPNSSWLKVTSKNTNYIVRVKANSTDFSGDKGTIPVNAVSMKVDGPANSASSVAPSVSLSTIEQVVFNGKATGANSHLLDVRYFITKSEAEQLATRQPGQYTTTLIYTLSPP